MKMLILLLFLASLLLELEFYRKNSCSSFKGFCIKLFQILLLIGFSFLSVCSQILYWLLEGKHRCFKFSFLFR